jgi:hypothetical protein
MRGHLAPARPRSTVLGHFLSLAARRLRSCSLPVRSASHHHRFLIKVGVLATALKTNGRSGHMLDPLTAAEIQAVRLKLVAFANRHSDQTVRSQCLAVDAKLAEVVEGDTPILRQVLANFVEQLEEALCWAARSTIEKATFHFLTGLRRRGSLSA